MEESNNSSVLAGSKRILIVEDEEALANALKLKLTSEKFNVAWAPNGAIALEMLEKQSFDLILTDLILPVMDGFAMMQKLQEKGNKIPIIVLSNLGQAEGIDHAKSLGAIEFLIKSNVPLARIPDYINKILK